MRAFASTLTAEERAARDRRIDDDALRRKENRIRAAREAGDSVVFLVWNYDDVYHPYIEHAFTNRGDAETFAKLEGGFEWSPLRVHKSIESALREDDEQ